MLQVDAGPNRARVKVFDGPETANTPVAPPMTWLRVVDELVVFVQNFCSPAGCCAVTAIPASGKVQVSIPAKGNCPVTSVGHHWNPAGQPVAVGVVAAPGTTCETVAAIVVPAGADCP